MPTLPHPDFKGRTGNGDFADVLVQTDAYVGRLLDTIDELGIRDNTIFSGPWSGSYFTGREGSLRVPFIIRWPAGDYLVQHMGSLQKEPPIRPGTPDPYDP